MKKERADKIKKFIQEGGNFGSNIKRDAKSLCVINEVLYFKKKSKPSLKKKLLPIASEVHCSEWKENVHFTIEKVQIVYSYIHY